MERQVYLYKITNPKGRIYIGQTVNPLNRFKVYERNAIPNQHRLKSSISKYGWYAHTTEIITTVSESSSNFAEQYLIAYYNSTGKDGMNILFGGSIKKTPEMNRNHSVKMTGKTKPQEFKDFISKMMRGNSYAKGAVRTEEFKKNASLKLRGIKRNSDKYKHPKDYLRKPVLSFDMNGNLIKEYTKLSDVVLDGFDKASVSKVCLKLEGRTQHKGVVFKFKSYGQYR